MQMASVAAFLNNKKKEEIITYLWSVSLCRMGSSIFLLLEKLKRVGYWQTLTTSFWAVRTNLIADSMRSNSTNAAQWFGKAKNKYWVSTEPLACSFACLLAPLTQLLALPCSLCLRILLRSFVCSLTLKIMGKCKISCLNIILF